MGRHGVSGGRPLACDGGQRQQRAARALYRRHGDCATSESFTLRRTLGVAQRRSGHEAVGGRGDAVEQGLRLKPITSTSSKGPAR